MKIAELLRTIADLVDTENNNESKMEVDNQFDEQEIWQSIEEKQSEELEEISKLAGIAKANTEPDIHVYPLSSAYPAGDDFHHSKNPSDMRSDSVSLYPGYGAKK